MQSIPSIVLLLFCFNNFLFAQNTYIDSLIRLDQANVYFETGASDLDSVAIAYLQTLYTKSMEQECDSIYVNAHTDNVGETTTNLSLSLQRAKTVKAYLVQLGIADNQIKIEEFGESRPIASNETERGRKLNRRSEVETYKKMRLTALSGYLLDRETGKGIRGNVYVGSSTMKNSLITDDNGFFETKVPINVVLKIRRDAFGYATVKDTLFRSKPSKDTQIKLYLTPIKAVTSYLLRGQLVDSLSEHTLQGEVVWKIGDKERTLKTDKDGFFELLLPESKEAILNILVKDYLPITQKITFEEKQKVKIFRLSPLKKGRAIAFKDLMFLLGEPTLMESSQPELDRILQFLQLNTSVRVEIAGHVDDSYNPPAEKSDFSYLLSSARAKTIYLYLIDKGIESARLQHQGYANWQPAFQFPKSEEEHTANRRVEIKILNDD